MTNKLATFEPRETPEVLNWTIADLLDDAVSAVPEQQALRENRYGVWKGWQELDLCGTQKRRAMCRPLSL